jgi:hypothetical protein
MKSNLLNPFRQYFRHEGSAPEEQGSSMHYPSGELSELRSEEDDRDMVIWLVIDLGMLGFVNGPKWRLQVQQRWFGIRQSISVWLVMNQWRMGIREQPVFWFEFNDRDRCMFPDNMAI